MTQEQFRKNYKIIYGKLIMNDLDYHELLKSAATALTYIHLSNKSNDYKFHKEQLEKHLLDLDVSMAMIDERNEE